MQASPDSQPAPAQTALCHLGTPNIFHFAPDQHGPAIQQAPSPSWCNASSRVATSLRLSYLRCDRSAVLYHPLARDPLALGVYDLVGSALIFPCQPLLKPRFGKQAFRCILKCLPNSHLRPLTHPIHLFRRVSAIRFIKARF